MNLYCLYSQYSSDDFDHLMEMLTIFVQVWCEYVDSSLGRG